MIKIKIKKGDTVVIIAGKDRGKNGKVLNVFPKTERILVEGVGLRKKHRRARRAGQKGEVVTLPAPVHMSNAMLLCKNCGKGARIGYKLPDNGDKAGICQKRRNQI